jgi:hypothetical protein
MGNMDGFGFPARREIIPGVRSSGRSKRTGRVLAHEEGPGCRRHRQRRHCDHLSRGMRVKEQKWGTKKKRSGEDKVER